MEAGEELLTSLHVPPGVMNSALTPFQDVNSPFGSSLEKPIEISNQEASISGETIKIIVSALLIKKGRKEFNNKKK